VKTALVERRRTTSERHSTKRHWKQRQQSIDVMALLVGQNQGDFLGHGEQ
jgi:hypothetical protein